MATKRTSEKQTAKPRAKREQLKPKKKGAQTPSEAARADIPDDGEQPIGGKGAKGGRSTSG